MITPYFWLGVFLIIGYFVVTDKSLATFFVLMEKRLNLEYERMKWRILHNPNSPIVRYIIWRKSIKLAKELQKEFNEKN
jgi:hypothetical protein